jgi:hypothetical protein
MKNKETLEEGFDRIDKSIDYSEFDFPSFKLGAKWQQEQFKKNQKKGVKMTSDRIRQIQEQTAYPKSISVMLALKQVWNECEQELYSEEKIIDLIQFLSMNEDFNGYGSVSKNTAKIFLDEYLHSK